MQVCKYVFFGGDTLNQSQANPLLRRAGWLEAGICSNFFGESSDLYFYVTAGEVKSLGWRIKAIDEEGLLSKKKDAIERDRLKEVVKQAKLAEKAAKAAKHGKTPAAALEAASEPHEYLPDDEDYTIMPSLRFGEPITINVDLDSASKGLPKSFPLKIHKLVPNPKFWEAYAKAGLTDPVELSRPMLPEEKAFVAAEMARKNALKEEKQAQRKREQQLAEALEAEDGDTPPMSEKEIQQLGKHLLRGL